MCSSYDYSGEAKQELAEKIMLDIMWTVNNNKKLELKKYINQTLEAERMILEKITSGSPDVLKLEKIKEAKAYKASEYDSPYFHYLLWQDIFAEDYGDAPEPTYMAIKVPTIIETKNDMKQFLDSLDERYREKYEKALRKYNKDTIKTYKLPLIITYNKGIPKELHNIINTKRVIQDNCKVLYIILETIGFYVKEDETLTSMLSKDISVKK